MTSPGTLVCELGPDGPRTRLARLLLWVDRGLARVGDRLRAWADRLG